MTCFLLLIFPHISSEKHKDGEEMFLQIHFGSDQNPPRVSCAYVGGLSVKTALCTSPQQIPATKIWAASADQCPVFVLLVLNDKTFQFGWEVDINTLLKNRKNESKFQRSGCTATLCDGELIAFLVRKRQKSRALVTLSGHSSVQCAEGQGNFLVPLQSGIDNATWERTIISHTASTAEWSLQERSNACLIVQKWLSKLNLCSTWNETIRVCVIPLRELEGAGSLCSLLTRRNGTCIDSCGWSREVKAKTSQSFPAGILCFSARSLDNNLNQLERGASLQTEPSSASRA